MNFKLIYIANVRIPTEKAHGIQIMQMCEALVDAGMEVNLIIPSRFNKIKKDPFEYYGVKQNFKIKRLPVIDLIWFNFPFAFFIETFTFFISVFFYLLFQRDYVLYTRGEMILGLKSFLRKKPVFWETHIKPQNFNLYQKILKKIRGLVVVTKYYKEELIYDYNVPANRILYAPDGVDFDKFNIAATKEGAGKKINLPLDKKIVLYTGSFLSWKGTDIFLDVAAKLPPDVLLVLVAGGEKEDIEEFQNKLVNSQINNILIIKYRPPSEIPYYLKAADILTLTGTKRSDISLYYTSPMKLFEYMASRRPILAADAPSFREILDNKNAFFYEPDNADDFIEKVNFIFGNYSLTEEKAMAAFEKVKEFTWRKRAEKILKFILSS